MATKGKAMNTDDKQQTQGSGPLLQGSNANQGNTSQTGRRPARKRRDGGHLSDAVWEEQSPDPRNRRE